MGDFIESLKDQNEDKNVDIENQPNEVLVQTAKLGEFSSQMGQELTVVSTDTTVSEGTFFKDSISRQKTE